MRFGTHTAPPRIYVLAKYDAQKFQRKTLLDSPWFYSRACRRYESFALFLRAKYDRHFRESKQLYPTVFSERFHCSVSKSVFLFLFFDTSSALINSTQEKVVSIYIFRAVFVSRALVKRDSTYAALFLFIGILNYLFILSKREVNIIQVGKM